MSKRTADSISEQVFIAREQAKCNARLLRMLRLAANEPLVMSHNTVETLTVNGWLEFGGPSELCRYNHDRLTQSGRAMLLILEAAIAYEVTA